MESHVSLLKQAPNKQQTYKIQHVDSVCYQVFYLLGAFRESTCKRSRDFILTDAKFIQ